MDVYFDDQHNRVQIIKNVKIHLEQVRSVNFFQVSVMKYVRYELQNVCDRVSVHVKSILLIVHVHVEELHNLVLLEKHAE